MQAKRFEHLFQRDILSILFHCHPLIEWWKLAMVSAPKDASTCLPHCGEHCSKECDDKGDDDFERFDVGIRGSVMSCRVRFLPRQDGKMCWRWLRWRQLWRHWRRGRFDQNAEIQQNTVTLLWHVKRRGKTEVPLLPPEAKWQQIAVIGMPVISVLHIFVPLRRGSRPHFVALFAFNRFCGHFLPWQDKLQSQHARMTEREEPSTDQRWLSGRSRLSHITSLYLWNL